MFCPCLLDIGRKKFHRICHTQKKMEVGGHRNVMIGNEIAPTLCLQRVGLTQPNRDSHAAWLSKVNRFVRNERTLLAGHVQFSSVQFTLALGSMSGSASKTRISSNAF